MNLVIAARACHCDCFVGLLLDCRVRSNVEFSLLTVFEQGEVNCEFADSQLAHSLPRPPLHIFHFLLLAWAYTAEV